jgi:thioesterase domain-containing protein
MTRGASLIALNEAPGGRALYCVHTAAGQATTYRELAEQLTPEIQAYGFEAVGLRGDAEPYQTVEEMARAYADKICEVQPIGPYHVLGYSAGGLVAYEIGRTLLDRQRQVQLLALVDTAIFPERVRSVPDAEYLNRYYWVLLISVLFKKQFEWIFNKTHVRMRSDPDTYTGSHPFWDLTEENRLIFLFNALPVHSKAPAWRNASFDKVDRYAKFLRSQWYMMQSYSLKPYPGHLTYFEAADGYDPRSKEILGAYAGSCSVITVPGSHLTMLGEDNVAVIAHHLRRLQARKALEESEPLRLK